MTARNFFFVAAGIFLLAAAYGLGASRLEAQGGTTFAGISTLGTGSSTLAITTSGDVYFINAGVSCQGWLDPGCEWTFIGNVLDQPISTDASSFGKIKGAYR